MGLDTKHDVVSETVVTSVYYNIILQLLIKATTFIQNALVLRHVSQEVIGLVFVRLFLFKMSALSVSREPFRKAALSFNLSSVLSRSTPSNDILNGQTVAASERKGSTEDKTLSVSTKKRKRGKKNETQDTTSSSSENSRPVDDNPLALQQFVNVLWLVLPLGVILVLCFSYIWATCFTKPIDELLYAQYDQAVLGFAFAAVCEIIAEPFWIICQSLMYVRFKVLVEAMAHFFKTALILFLIVCYPHLGLCSFVIAEIVSSLVTLLSYVVFVAYITQTKNRFWFWSNTINFTDFLPRYVSAGALLDFQLFKLIISFVKQSLLKLILSEGERFVMTIFNVISLSEQGVYEVINNLGSIPARIIFYPTEESTYLFFAKAIRRGVPARYHDENVIEVTTKILSIMLKSMILIGLVFFVFGFSYSQLLLRIYGGESLASGSSTLLMRSYCFYVVVLAVNGITEAFVTAAMSKDDVEKYSNKMVLFSVVFLASAYCLSTLFGSVGFILANCVNFLARIAHNIHYTSSFYRGTSYRPVLSALPSIPVSTALIISFTVGFFSENVFCCVYGMLNIMIHVAIGGMCLLSVAITLLISDKELVNYIKEKVLFKGKLE